MYHFILQRGADGHFNTPPHGIESMVAACARVYGTKSQIQRTRISTTERPRAFIVHLTCIVLLHGHSSCIAAVDIKGYGAYPCASPCSCLRHGSSIRRPRTASSTCHCTNAPFLQHPPAIAQHLTHLVHHLLHLLLNLLQHLCTGRHLCCTAAAAVDVLPCYDLLVWPAGAVVQADSPAAGPPAPAGGVIPCRKVCSLAGSWTLAAAVAEGGGDGRSLRSILLLLCSNGHSNGSITLRWRRCNSCWQSCCELHPLLLQLLLQSLVVLLQFDGVAKQVCYCLLLLGCTGTAAAGIVCTASCAAASCRAWVGGFCGWVVDCHALL